MHGATFGVVVGWKPTPYCARSRDPAAKTLLHASLSSRLVTAVRTSSPRRPTAEHKATSRYIASSHECALLPNRPFGRPTPSSLDDTERIATPSSSQDRTALEGLLTVGGVCELLNVSRQTLYRVIGAGELIPIRVSKSPRFAPDEVRRYLERQRQVSLR